MTQNLVTDLGEEQLMKGGFDGLSVTVGLYNDSSDNLSDSDDISAVTTEPSDLAPNYGYSRQSATFSASDLSGDWGVDNDVQISFDLSGDSTSNDVDTAIVIYNFQASDTGDASAQDHLIANPALSQTRDIGSIDTVQINAGNLEITVD